jgi:phosphoribosylanthranilate isomerase
VDAKAAIAAGCDALGFIFFKQSPRYIRPQAAEAIIKQLPRNIIKVGVFVDAPEKSIKKIAKLCGLDILQFHGQESPAFCQRFKSYKVIKVFRVRDKIDLGRLREYNTFAYLFDTFSKSKAGGTGKSFNWEILRYPADLRQLIFLSGGLHARNVRGAIAMAHPDWVDASTALERSPGKKDHAKVRRFIQAAKS